ncbi:MAG TPA: hypothetical protein VKA30_02310 [Actinomycetota bacterium]|nr:hypothetical protein [Actinomycetota bacterium]
MSDLDQWFRELDGLDAPNLWETIEDRPPRHVGHHGRNGAIAAAMALVVAALGVGLIVRAFNTTERPTRRPVKPVVSDNGLIAFTRLVHGRSTIYTTTLGGREEKLFDGHEPSWSPDGSRLLFWSASGEQLVLKTFIPGDRPHAILRVDPPDGEHGLPDRVHPSWSSDGSSIAFSWWGAVYTIRADGSQLRHLDGGGGFIADYAPAWRPGTKKISFIRQTDANPTPVIYEVLVSGGEPKPIGGTAGAQSFAWSPDGRSIVFAAPGEQRPRENQDLFLLHVAHPSNLPRNISKTAGVSEHEPTWSPDGKLIAYSISGGSIAARGIFVMSSGGTDAHAIGQGSGYPLDCCPAWQALPASPPDMSGDAETDTLDGAVVFGRDEGGRPWVYLRRADGSEERIAEGSEPSWSLDGSQIVFRFTTEGRTAIRLVAPDGTDLKTVTSFAGPAPRDTGPVVNRSGRIAFATFEGIFVVNSDGSDMVEVVRYQGDHACYDLAPDWSPAGDQIVFEVECEGGSEGLWIVDANGAGLRQLTNPGPYGTNADRHPAWSLDGQIAFDRQDGRGLSTIWVVNPDGSGLRQMTSGLRHDEHPTWSSGSPASIAFDATPADSPTQIEVVYLDGSGPTSLFDTTGSASDPDWIPVSFATAGTG